MRRPRSKLEVSTFPFLAVLLCAMGALLLLLFIMDRRAKIAAQHTASEAVAERKKRTEAEEQARHDEWQKAKDQLHQTLLDQHGQVLADAKGAQHNLDVIAGKVANAQSQHLDLKGKLDRESSQIAALQAQIASQRAGLTDVDLKDRKAKAELLEAAKELAEIERAFQQLRALKDREKHVYSVVPYRGKRGEARAPIYVECVRGGVVFHPEKKTLGGWDFTPEMMKSEVERRTGTLGVEKTLKEKSRTIAEERKGPYVLFLIRPEGIASYYQAQAGLKGYDLDFGYELVDQDWVLDFNGDPKAKPAPPPTALANNSDMKKSAGSPPLLGPVEKGTSRGDMPAGSSPPSDSKGKGRGDIPYGPPLLGPTEKGIGRGDAPSPLQPPRAGGNPVGPAQTLGNSSYGGSGSGVPNKGAAFVPIAKMPPPTVPGVLTGGNGGAKSDTLRPIGTPIPGQNVGIKPGDGGSNTKSGSSETNVVGTDEGLPQSTPSLGRDDAKKPTPPPIRLLGNRDFIITIDCYADHATVFPSGLQYRWSGPNPNASDTALVNAVSNLITRRQATVRTGEPAYRPVIRFQVAPDGLRTYLRIYPLLAPLNVMMTRENVQD